MRASVSSTALLRSPPDGNTLNAKSRANRNGGTLQMTHGNELREFSVLADLAGQHTSVSVSGWDVSSKSELKYEATDAIISGEFEALLEQRDRLPIFAERVIALPKAVE